MFTCNSTELTSVPIIAYNSNVYFAQNDPFSHLRSHICNFNFFIVTSINCTYAYEYRIPWPWRIRSCWKALFTVFLYIVRCTTVRAVWIRRVTAGNTEITSCPLLLLAALCIPSSISHPPCCFLNSSSR